MVKQDKNTGLQTTIWGLTKFKSLRVKNTAVLKGSKAILLTLKYLQLFKRLFKQPLKNINLEQPLKIFT